MANFSQLSITRDNAFAWALIVSITLHVLAALELPGISFEKMLKPDELVVELAPPKPAPPPPPEPPKPPEPVKPKVVPPPKPIPQNLPKPVVTHTPQPISEPPPPAVIAAAPKAEAPPPTFVAPPPEPPKPTVNQVDVDAAKNQYGSILSREIAKHKQYPKIAQMRGWQGDVLLDLQLDGSGNVLSSKVHTSSGFEALDKQALEMVKKASPFPMPPESLRAKAFSVMVPVSFKLE